ncbi:CusA/CzcA family heavy metal efflux RND transporter [Hymenobacter sp. BRD128]|uniref:CusA/CzcA family heavy metal efflux RND transporter n=1 Tax=Hymenobacter sp. BRD128 TaxID=2675878 RepID=UPI001566BC3D|nr:CusA/CzcA family heavy metal efflux RND transporter [Hymenobacter sp. BRD128]QKG56348.1 CusA/CzcA family heavy metal efflux RND transporter [Hymenobacter sp. BRD128]
MLEKIIAASVRNKLIVGLLLLGLIAWGGFSAANLPLDAIPDVTNNQVQVITQSPALAAQEVEQMLTIPLELQLRTIPGVTEIRSISRFGLSVITVVFPDNVDTYRTRQLVAEKLTQAQGDLVAGSGTPGMAPITTGLGEIYQYSIRVEPGYEKRYSLAQLRDVQDWIVKRRLAGVAGVVDVSSFGGFVRQYEVAVDPNRLAANNVTMAELYQALQDNNGNTGGSYLERGPNAYFIRGEGRATSLADLGATVIKQAAPGQPLLVRDVATVRYGHAVRYGAMTRNGHGETVGGIVLMLKGASSENTIKNVKQRVAEIQKTLPKGLVITPFLDRTKLVDKAIATVEHNLIEGGIIVLAVLLLLLGNWRAAVVVALMIPLCMLFALGMMSMFGVSANLMSLGALDFGLIVDGAVIIVEAVIFHLVHQREQAAHETMDDMTEHAATRLMSSALFGQFIILIVYFPILSLTGIEGKMFRPMALTVSFAIIGAMLMCLTFVPAATAWALKKDIKEEGTLAYRIMRFLHRGYDPIIRAALGARWLVAGAAVGLLVLAGFIFSRMGGEFIPQLDEGDIALNVTLAPGSSLSQTIATNSRVQQILLQKFPEIEQIVGKSGTSEIPTDPMSLEDSDEMVILKDRKEWTSASSREELANKMQAALAGIPGVTMEFQQPIQMRFNELISGVKSDVSIKIFGDDLAVLFEKANDAADLIRPLQGVGDLKVEQIAALPQMRVSYNRQKLAQYGLKVSDLNNLLRSSFAGDVAGQVYEGERRYDLVVRLDSAHRQGLANLQDLYVDTPGGQKIPLDEVAQVSYHNAPIQISRDDARRRINIGINVRGRDVQSLVEEIQQKLNTGLKLPPGYTLQYGGQFENLVQAKKRLSIAVPVSLTLIFMLLYLSFRSVKQALLIFTGVPLATIGGIVALWLRGMPFSISAGVGFIALFGVAVLNGIVLLASLNELAAEGVKSVRERVLRATEERFRPVILTASVASLGFLPMALSTSAGAEVQKPLATVVIGGLISATLLTLIVLPVLYSFFTKDGEPNPEEAAEAEEKAKHAAEVGEAPPAEDGKANGNQDKNPAPQPAPVVASLVLLLGLLGAASGAHAQNTFGSTAGQPLNLNQALQTAGVQNQSLQTSSLQVQQQRALIRTGIEPPRTTVDSQFGQVSSNLIDHTFNVIQQTAFPGVYLAQRQLLQSQSVTAEQQARLNQRTLAGTIRTSFYSLLVTYRRVALLRRQDSLYRRAARAARIRYQVGETNRLEQVAAEARASELENRLLTTLSDLDVQRAQLGQLLGQAGPAAIDTTAALVAPLTPADTAALSPESNPTLGLLRQQVAVSEQQTKVERLRRLPDLRAGYFQQSIRPEFRALNVGQLGLAFPLLGGAGRARVAAARIGEQVAAGQLSYATAQLSTQLRTLRMQLRRARASLDYYEKTALPQARLILATAEKSFRAGDVDYVTYVVNTDPAWQILNNYLDQAQRYNEVVVNIETLVGTGPTAAR